NLLLQGFPGPVYPVNPNAPVVASVKAYPSILEVPGEVDLALVVVPADLVQSMVEQCGRKGVRGIVVISAGFGESGEGGAEKQKLIVEVARRYGMRLVGPNCMGVINTDPEVNLNGTFAPVFPPAGNIAMCSQSGALGIAILEYAKSLNLGLSSFISIGNRADVSNNDLIQYWEDDPATKIILLYLESFGNPREFGRVARRVAAVKPIVAVKSGRTAAGKRAAASHTGALASAEVASEALFRQAGMIRVDTLEELFDVANLLSHQPIPRGRRVAVLTNGGGPGIMTADACSARGLELPLLSEKTSASFKKILPNGAAITNPVDMTAGAGPDEYRQVLQTFLEEDYIDIVIVIFIPPIVTHPEEVAQAIRDMAPAFRRQGKTVVASFMGARGVSWELGSREEGYIPSFTFPEATATVLAKACEYGEWVKKPKGMIPRFDDINKEKAEEIIKKAVPSTPGRPIWLEASATLELFQHYGIRTAPTRLAVTVGQAALAAREIGFPAVIKLLSRTITHKTEVEGVKVNLKSEGEVEQAFLELRENLTRLGKAAEMQGVIVQKMIPKGVEVIIGVTQDPSFGPLLMFGLGGIYAELFKDVAFRLHPLTDIDSQEIIRSVKAFELLKGWRGSPPSDISSVEKLLCRISALIEDHPRIAELDLNPVIVQGEGQGCQVVDARILIN
ncbi:MAG: acetate--CoA ligase family protein, partial [bacterium]|nr:acetate--CoA ligase family protein [bacterium]